MKKNAKIQWTEHRVVLRKAFLFERRKIYQWLTKSNITHSMMGPPLYPDALIPTWEEFTNDYSDDFFQDKPNNTGRCFIVEVGGKEVGTVGYDLLNPKKKWALLDIWLKDEKVCHHGYGSEALILISKYLNKAEGIRYFYISPSLRNQRAIGAYEKAGFIKLRMKRKEAKIKFSVDVFDYKDNVMMRMTMSKKNKSGTREKQVQ